MASKSPLRFALFFSMLLFVLIVVLLSYTTYTLIPRTTLESFSTIFVSILIEAFPFILIGVTLSSVIQVLVTPSFLQRILPKNTWLAIFLASITGFIFPICECANVPVTRRLVQKGLPLPIAITFMLAVAIMNPVVLLSTFYAFGGNWRVVFLRGGLGMVCAILIGILSRWFSPKSPLRDKYVNDHAAACNCGHGHDHEEDCCDHDEEPHAHHHHTQSHQAFQEKRGFLRQTWRVLDHTSLELFSVGRFLILGAMISAMMQTFLPRQYLLFLGQDRVLSILVMMGLAYVLSLCSEADAFIARTFVGQFSSGSIMAFMLYGPIMDVKNTLMLLEGFKPKFVLRLNLVAFIVCFSFAWLVQWIQGLRI